MKRNKFWGVSLVTTLMVLGLTACSNDEFADYKYEDNGIKSFTSFTATIGEEAITRAYLGDAGVEGKKRMYWNEGDEIAVFSDADSDFKTFKVTNVSGDNKATIQGDKISGTAFYGYYPNRDANLALDKDNPKLLHASLSANDFDEGESTLTPMVAISNSNNLAFKQVTGMIHVSIGGIYRLEKVTLFGNDNEVLYGIGTIDLSADEPVFKLDSNQGGNKSLGGTIRQGDEQLVGEGMVDIYFSLPPMTLAKGFTLEIKGYYEGGKSIVYQKSTKASVVIKRAQINHYTLENVVEELNAQGNDGIIEFVDENVKAICVENWDTDGDGELSYSEASLVTNINKAFGYNESIQSFVELQYFIGLKELPEDAFYYCKNLKRITLPENITKIGIGAFRGCSNLTNFQIPNKISSIGGGAFSECFALKNIILPEGITVIANNTFADCINLESIFIPETVTIIGFGVFYNCRSLKTINIPADVTYIGNSVFYNCSGLKSISIPNGITTIGNNTFNGCSSLIDIALPSHLESIGEEAFGGCI